MGWDYFHRLPDESVKEIIEKYYAYSGDKYKVLDVKIVKLKTAYIALQDNIQNRICGVVWLLDYKKDYFNFGHKIIDEESGPCESACPESILNMLDLLPDDPRYHYAKDWREECRVFIQKEKDRKANPLAIGDRIRTAKEIKFNDGSVADTFVVSGQKNVYHIVQNSAVYRTVRIPQNVLDSIGFQIVV